MKAYRFLIALLTLTALVSCQKEFDNIGKISNVKAPADVNAQFDITQDNSGLVTIYPSAEGVTEYKITFGDTTSETPTKYGLNESIQHIYQEGEYKVGITAIGITGLATKIEKDLSITYKAPENLEISVEQDPTNPAIVTVSATADFVTVFEIYFGDQENEVPEHFLPGENINHTYGEPGTYTIKVIAKSAGAATSEKTAQVIVNGASDPVNLPITFESFTVNYAFTDFGNAVSTVIDNPDTSGINTSDKVAEFVKPAGAEVWAGTFLTLENPIDFSTNKLFKMKVWSPKAGAVVKLKVENLTDGDITDEVDATTTVSNQWEELSFDFSQIDMTNEYQKVVVFFDFGNPGDDAIYYYDDIKLVPASFPTTLKIEDFEGEAPAFTAFGNISDIEVVANPDQSGLNTTANVAKLVKDEGSETWAGCFFGPAVTMDLDNYKKFKVLVWSPKAGAIVKLKLENPDASITYEVDVTTTTANAWEELVYDFSDAPAAEYTNFVIFMDFGNPGDGSIYYFDEIEMFNEGGGSTTIPFQDFEGEPPAFTSFGNIADIEVLANPDQTGVNTTATVAKLTKTEGSEVWGGAFFENPEPLDIVSYPNIKVKTWSPKSGIDVKLKLENEDASVSYEVDLNTSVANQWEDLSFNFSDAPAADYIRVVIFFDFGNTGDDTVYYFDEFALSN